jgi:Recombination endonuclease VII
MSTQAKEKARAKRLMDNYKLTIEQYDRILAHQGGVCYCCGQSEPVKGRRLSVDHNHQTGQIRGLLCSRCNPILGKLERAFQRYGLHKTGLKVWTVAYKIAQYLVVHPATQALGFEHFGYAGRTNTKAHRKRLKRDRKKLT